MKILASLLMVLLLACPVWAEFEPPLGSGVDRVMEITNPVAELDQIRLLSDTVAVYAIFGHISEVDGRILWRQFQILKHRYPGVKKLLVYISSWGGSGFDGVGLADVIIAIKNTGMVVEAHAYGKIASAAIPVYVVCSKRYATKNTVFMLHKAKVFKWFADEDKDMLEKQLEMLAILRAGYIGLIASHTGLGHDELLEKINAETWFLAPTALEWGFVDVIE